MEQAAQGKALEPDASSDASAAELYSQLARSAPGGSAFGTEPSDSIEAYRLSPEHALPEFSGAAAGACAVTPPTHYAAICAGSMPLRRKAIEACKGLVHPNLANLAAAGESWVSSLGEKRTVLIFERPRGKKLLELIEGGKRMPERFVSDQVLEPLTGTLLKFAEQGIAHGRINLTTVFFGDKVTLGECLSEPCGYSQEFYCEPPERISLLPYAKGESNLSIDCYALGLLALQLVVGKPVHRETDHAEFAAHLLHEGAYPTFAGNDTFTDHFQDFLRGTLADNVQERWGLLQIKSWLDGKRFNLVHSGPPRDASRPYLFASQELGNFRSVAHAYFTRWDAAKLDLRDNKLRRWLSTSAHRKEIAEQLQRVLNTTGGESTKNERLNNELVTRSLLVLDPAGPLRYRNLSMEVDGLGGVVAHAYRAGSQEELQNVADIIDLDFISTWSNLQKDTGPSEATALVWKLQRVRMLLRITSLGSGMERCLYDLNPNLACQSPLIVAHHALTAEQALRALDRVAAVKGRDNAPVDRHIAAFLCSRQDITKDVRITDLSFAPGLMTNYDLISLELLRLTQSRTGNIPLKGLSLWMGARLLGVAEKLHSKQLRASMRSELMRAAQTGILARLSEVILNVELIREDEEGFQRAHQRYFRLSGKIERLSNGELLTARAQAWGTRLARTVSLLLLCIVGYNVMLERL